MRQQLATLFDKYEKDKYERDPQPSETTASAV